eukprot:3594774-Pyramimonas_sp.AAC.1
MPQVFFTFSRVLRRAWHPHLTDKSPPDPLRTPSGPPLVRNADLLVRGAERSGPEAGPARAENERKNERKKRVTSRNARTCYTPAIVSHLARRAPTARPRVRSDRETT